MAGPHLRGKDDEEDEDRPPSSDPSESLPGSSRLWKERTVHPVGTACSDSQHKVRGVGVMRQSSGHREVYPRRPMEQRALKRAGRSHPSTPSARATGERQRVCRPELQAGSQHATEKLGSPLHLPRHGGGPFADARGGTSRGSGSRRPRWCGSTPSAQGRSSSSRQGTRLLPAAARPIRARTSPRGAPHPGRVDRSASACPFIVRPRSTAAPAAGAWPGCRGPGRRRAARMPAATLPRRAGAGRRRCWRW